MVQIILHLPPFIFNKIIDFMDYDTYCNFLQIFPVEQQKTLTSNFKNYKAYKNRLCCIINEIFFNEKIMNKRAYMSYYSTIFNLSSDSNIKNILYIKSHRLSIIEAFTYLILRLNNTSSNNSIRQISNIFSFLNRTFNCYCQQEQKDIQYYLNNKDKLYEKSIYALNTFNEEKINYLKMFKEIR